MGVSGATDATNLLQNHYAAVSILGSLAIGSGKTIFFNSADAVRNFLPQSGAPGQLTDTIVFNPLTTSAGSFAGEVLALRLNVGFSDTGFLGDADVSFGDLRIHNVPELGPGLNFTGLTVRELYDIAGSVLGGQSPAAYFTTIASLNSVSAELNRSFGGGYVTDWALAHLRFPGDFNADGTVNGADYVVSATAWAPSTPKAITKPGEARSACSSALAPLAVARREFRPPRCRSQEVRRCWSWVRWCWGASVAAARLLIYRAASDDGLCPSLHSCAAARRGHGTSRRGWWGDLRSAEVRGRETRAQHGSRA